jgi:homoserine acetyltransferase
VCHAASLVTQQFEEIKQQSGHSPFLTDEQQQWLTIQQMLAATSLSVGVK